MDLPQRAALFTNIVLGDNRCLFYILQAKDLESSTELAMRIETEIGRSKQFRNARCRVRTIVTPVDLPQTAEGLDIEELAAQIDAQISQAIAINGNGDQPAPAGALKPNRYVAVG